MLMPMLMFLYVTLCVFGFLFFFLRDDTFAFLFEKKYDGITDYNDPEFTGGVHYEFNPFHSLRVK